MTFILNSEQVDFVVIKNNECFARIQNDGLQKISLYIYNHLRSLGVKTIDANKTEVF